MYFLLYYCFYNAIKNHFIFSTMNLLIILLANQIPTEFFWNYFGIKFNEKVSFDKPGQFLKYKKLNFHFLLILK
jgi:hypothetical protein